MRQSALLALLIAMFLGAVTPTTAGQASSFELRASPLLDLHTFVRLQLSAEERQEPQIPGMAEAVAAARDLEAALGNPLYWGLIEPLLAQSDSAGAFEAALERLPEEQRLRDGTVLRLRAPAAAYAKALATVEPVFLERIWPARQEAIERARGRLAGVFNRREADCVAHLVESLDMQDPGVAVPVYLVASAPTPQGFTHRSRGGAICIIGVEEADDSLLAEMLLHELIHALDLATAGKPSALNALRTRLEESGIGPATRAGRDVPHTLMFVQAAATVQTLLDPAHEAYGEARGYYARVPAAAGAVREAWERRLTGELTPGGAVDRIAAAALAAQGAPGAD